MEIHTDDVTITLTTTSDHVWLGLPVRGGQWALRPEHAKQLALALLRAAELAEALIWPTDAIMALTNELENHDHRGEEADDE